MYLSIIGSPGSGKTTLFQAFSATAGGSASGVAVVDVPDERIDKLAAIFKPRKIVYGRVEMSDMPSFTEGDLKNETIPAKQLQQMRTSDAFIVVLRNFDNGLTVDPIAEFQAIHNEFIFADLMQIEGRLERIKKQGGKKDNTALEQERLLLEQCLAHVGEGKPLATLPMPESDGKALRGFQFLSQKPLMVVLNCSEETIKDADAMTTQVRAKLPDELPVVAACARLEAELASMDAEDQETFMAEYGLSESLRGRLIGLAYRTLGLISFLTVGEDECRAWPIRKGIPAQEAAATIHTDLSDRFIRAETVAYEDFMRHGDFAGCKKAGVWRLEGKQYIVRDGDIISIRAGA
jgi:GTP-binding protein YchF